MAWDLSWSNEKMEEMDGNWPGTSGQCMTIIIIYVIETICDNLWQDCSWSQCLFAIFCTSPQHQRALPVMDTASMGSGCVGYGWVWGYFRMFWAIKANQDICERVHMTRGHSCHSYFSLHTMRSAMIGIPGILSLNSWTIPTTLLLPDKCSSLIVQPCCAKGPSQGLFPVMGFQRAYRCWHILFHELHWRAWVGNENKMIIEIHRNLKRPESGAQVVV